MSLITCPDCSTQVSDAAPGCPKCGRPSKATTIEKTGKGWKTVQLLATLVTIGGCLTTIGAVSSRTADSAIGAGMAIFGLGLAAFIFARAGAWWAHG